MRKLFFLTGGILLLLFYPPLQGQVLKQTIRGQIVDQDANAPLVGVTLYIEGSSPLVGCVSNNEGQFEFPAMPVGRYNVIINYIGYESKTIPNVLLGAGKEAFLNINLIESVTKLDEVVVKANKNKGEPLNEMAMVSARSFTVEETQRYAGSMNDPGRLASSFAGVMCDPNGNNEIIIRGNSPKGMLWRIEGVPVPNPNHYANEGATGGPISILNTSTLSNSDFFTGAFPAEFGNAYSGVFDINLRKGNDQKREYIVQAGIMGCDLTAEGPFSDDYSGSYLINFRYSTLALLTATGVKVAGDAVPKFSDATVNIQLPTQSFGTFQLFSMAGTSTIAFDEEKWDGEGGSDLLVVGLNNVYPINNNTYLKTTLSYTGTISDWIENGADTSGLNRVRKVRTDYRYNTYMAATELTHKYSARHTFKAGAAVSKVDYKLYYDDFIPENNHLLNVLQDDGSSELVNIYGNWKYRAFKTLTFNTGVHYNYLNLNGSYAIEPRVGMQWKVTPTQVISAGFGQHSKSENISTYLSNVADYDGNYGQHNKELGFSKARHYVVGYENRLGKNLRVKAEAYYQDLYNVPVSIFDTSAYALLNETAGYITEALDNDGTGQNYGVELTVEKFFSDDYYFMFTGSFFDSKYIGADGVKRNTAFNNQYVLNGLVGKEWGLKRIKNSSIGLNIRCNYAGGMWYTPIDEKASQAAHEAVYGDYYSKKRNDYIRIDYKMNFRRNKKKSTRVWEIDIQNVTNFQGVTLEYFDTDLNRIEQVTQLGILPSINYRIEF